MINVSLAVKGRFYKEKKKKKPGHGCKIGCHEQRRMGLADIGERILAEVVVCCTTLILQWRVNMLTCKHYQKSWQWPSKCFWFIQFFRFIWLFLVGKSFGFILTFKESICAFFFRMSRYHTDWSLFGGLYCGFICTLWWFTWLVCVEKGLTFSDQVGSAPAKELLQAERQVFPETPGFHVPCITLPQFLGSGPSPIPLLLPPPLCLYQQLPNNDEVLFFGGAGICGILPTLLPLLYSCLFLEWLICLCAYFVMHSHLCLLWRFEPCSDALDHVPSARLCLTNPLLSERATGCHAPLLQSFVGMSLSSNSEYLWWFSKCNDGISDFWLKTVSSETPKQSPCSCIHSFF